MHAAQLTASFLSDVYNSYRLSGAHRCYLLLLPNFHTLTDKRLAPDGGYFPRIIFLSPTGELLQTKSRANPKYGYYFSNADSIVAAMKEAIEEVGNADAADLDL